MAKTAEQITRMESIMVSPLCAARSFDVHFPLEDLHRKLNARDAEPFEKARPDACRLECPDYPAVGPDAPADKVKDVGHADDVFFEAGDLRDVDTFSGAVAHARQLHDDRNG